MLNNKSVIVKLIDTVKNKNSHKLTISKNYNLNKPVFSLDKLLTSLIIQDSKLNINQNNILNNMSLYKDNNDFRET